MGAVYLAWHGGLSDMKKLCVVKTLRQDVANNQEYLNRFLDEARLTVHLNHRNIGQVFHVEQAEHVYFISMEFIPGRDLRTIFEYSQRLKIPFPEDIAIFLTSEMLAALEYAHRLKNPNTGEILNVVHRDISPHNVMISHEGEVKLIDFGLAASSQKKEKTDIKKVMGKLAYMSPEQARGDAIDARTDLFATAMVCFELISGTHYYGEMKQQEIWEIVGTGKYKPAALQHLPRTLAKILSRGLSPDLDERFSDAESFRLALESYSMRRGYRTSLSDVRKFFSRLFPDEAERIRTLLSGVKPKQEDAQSSQDDTSLDKDEGTASLPKTPAKEKRPPNTLLTPRSGIRSLAARKADSDARQDATKRRSEDKTESTSEDSNPHKKDVKIQQIALEKDVHASAIGPDNGHEDKNLFISMYIVGGILVLGVIALIAVLLA